MRVRVCTGVRGGGDLPARAAATAVQGLWRLSLLLTRPPQATVPGKLCYLTADECQSLAANWTTRRPGTVLTSLPEGEPLAGAGEGHGKGEGEPEGEPPSRRARGGEGDVTRTPGRSSDPLVGTPAYETTNSQSERGTYGQWHLSRGRSKQPND
eukprot:1313894-Rhodomonas_salina.1